MKFLRNSVEGMFLLFFCTSPIFAQKKKNVVKRDSLSTVIVGKSASNVLLNASSESEPRFINIGLPKMTTGTVVVEDGVLATYDNYALKTTATWRQDGSYLKTDSWDIANSAIKLGQIGYTVVTNSKIGSPKFGGALNYKTNSFGLMSGNIFINGPIRNNWFYAANLFMNFNPTTTHPNYTRFLDRTKSFKAIITKKYDNGKGEISFKWKYMNSQFEKPEYTPYIYEDGKQVKKLDNFKIGENNYLGSTDNYYFQDARTGRYKNINLMNYTGTTTHTFNIMGHNELKHGLDLNYNLNYQYASAGSSDFQYLKIMNTDDLPATKRYIYANKSNPQIYNGQLQTTNLSFGSHIPINTFQYKVELSKVAKKHNWLLGYNGSYFNINRFAYSSITYMQEINPDPQHVILQTIKDGVWTNAKADEYGQYGYNKSFLYYNGKEYKNAVYATDKWKVSKSLTLNLGARLELHHLNGDYLPSEAREDNWASRKGTKIDKHYLNKDFTLSLIYRIMKNFGVTASAYYIESSNGLNAYRGSNAPDDKVNKVPYYSGGIYYNSKYVSLISQITHISRSNLFGSGSFSNSNGDTSKQTLIYSVSTLGWTTDAILKPFKGFKMHLLLTLQNPKYHDFNFDVFGQHYDYDNIQVRTTSKTLAEIEPTYNFGKFSIWASARYFSKQPASYPASLWFPSRWETFAGLNYQCTPKVKFSLSAVNLLNQSGAQGYISGSNIILDGSSYDGKPIAGTYIRPFTIEVNTQIKF